METHAGDGDALPMSAEEEALGTISTVFDDGGQLDLNIPYASGITEDASAPAGSLGGETSITSSEITRPADVPWPCGVNNIISESSKRVQYKQFEQDEAVVLSEAQRNMDVATFDLNMSADTIPTASDNRVLTTAMIPVDSVKETPWKKRNRQCAGPDSREHVSGKASALQQALMKFADRRSENIMNPCIGTEFNDCDEAYEYYNLYSWECGFGIRWGQETMV